MLACLCINRFTEEKQTIQMATGWLEENLLSAHSIHCSESHLTKNI